MKHRWLVAGISLLGTCSSVPAAPQGEEPPAAVAPLALSPKPDLAVKAAMIEVAWLSDPLTYPFRLRADQGADAISISGFVPNELIRERAAALARNASAGITLRDTLVVLPNMAMPVELTTEPSQTSLVHLLVEKTVPALAKQIQLMIDGKGVVTVTGRVDELADRRKVIRALQALPGCTCVKYDLRMSPSVLVTMPTQRGLSKEPLKDLAPPMPVLPTRPANLKTTLGERSVISPSPLTSRTPVQQVEHKTATIPMVQVEPARGLEKSKDPSFLIPSASGLTPPAPAVTISSPAKAFKPTFLGNGFVIPAAAEQPTPTANKPPDLPTLPPAPPLGEPPALPVIPLPQGK